MSEGGREGDENPISPLLRSFAILFVWKSHFLHFVQSGGRKGAVLRISQLILVMFTNLRLYYLPHHPSLSDYVEHAANHVFFPGFKVDPSVSAPLQVRTITMQRTLHTDAEMQFPASSLSLSLFLRHPKKKDE